MFTSNSTLLSKDITTIITGPFGVIGKIFAISLNQLIKPLFSNNEVGFAYDPNDLTTLYQDAEGTIPVTAAGQPVGLVLDKSKGLVLGDELNNGSWAAGAGWSVNSSVATHVSGDTAGALNIQGAVVGKFYKITVKITVRAGVLQLYTNSNLLLNVSNVGTKTYTFYGWSSTSGNGRLIDFYARSSFEGDVDLSSISIKEIKGNHAYQTTSSMRPLLQNRPRKIDYDGVDDKLITNLPSQLTGCTVIRAVPNVGTQILTNQTIPATFEDSTDHCGLIVINRALTATETSQITKLFNKAAGV